MTYEYFKQHWQEECLKDGVLTIPDGVEELYHNCGIQGNQEITKVIFPNNGHLNIYGPVFQGCSNIESIKNFPPIYTCVEEFIDDETGETVSIKRTIECEVNSSVFYGCQKLFVNERDIDENGYMTIEINGKTYDLGSHENSRYDSRSHMSWIVSMFYKRLEETCLDKTKFTFRKTLNRHGKDYEYLFENGGLYNLTRSTFVMFLPEFSNGNLVIPEWVRSFDLLCDWVKVDGDYIEQMEQLDMVSLQFFGDTELDNLHSVKFPNLEKLIYSSCQEIIPPFTFRFCPNLSEIVFSDNLKRIGANSFTNCKNIKTLVFPASLEMIEDYDPREAGAFNGCTSLEEVTFNVGSDLAIGEMAFAGCRHLQKVHIRKCGDTPSHCIIRGFSHCESLVSIDVKRVNISVEKCAFTYCSSLQNINGFPDGYRLYGGGLFYKNHLLSSLSFMGELRFPEGADCLDETVGYVETLYLPASIKSIEEQPEDARYSESEWEPAYMRAQQIVVPVGYKEYFVQLFVSDYEANESNYYCFGDKYRNVRDTLNSIILEK